MYKNVPLFIFLLLACGTEVNPLSIIHPLLIYSRLQPAAFNSSKASSNVSRVQVAHHSHHRLESVCRILFDCHRNFLLLVIRAEYISLNTILTRLFIHSRASSICVSAIAFSLVANSPAWKHWIGASQSPADQCQVHHAVRLLLYEDPFETLCPRSQTLFHSVGHRSCSFDVHHQDQSHLPRVRC